MPARHPLSAWSILFTTIGWDQSHPVTECQFRTMAFNLCTLPDLYSQTPSHSGPPLIPDLHDHEDEGAEGNQQPRDSFTSKPSRSPPETQMERLRRVQAALKISAETFDLCLHLLDVSESIYPVLEFLTLNDDYFMLCHGPMAPNTASTRRPCGGLGHDNDRICEWALRQWPHLFHCS